MNLFKIGDPITLDGNVIGRITHLEEDEDGNVTATVSGEMPGISEYSIVE